MTSRRPPIKGDRPIVESRLSADRPMSFVGPRLFIDD